MSAGELIMLPSDPPVSGTLGHVQEMCAWIKHLPALDGPTFLPEVP